MNDAKPLMHCHKELIEDLNYTDVLPDSVLFSWFNDQYSTSKHLLTLYSIAVGLKAQKILEIGFGRSSFVLIKAAAHNKGHLLSCDTRDFSYLLNEREKELTTFFNSDSSMVWSHKAVREGIDFAFLDYFSSENLSVDFIVSEIRKCSTLVKENGIIAVHDSIDGRYNVNKALKILSRSFSVFPNLTFEILSLPFNYGLGLIRVKRSGVGVLNDHFVKKAEV